MQKFPVYSHLVFSISNIFVWCICHSSGTNSDMLLLMKDCSLSDFFTLVFGERICVFTRERVREKAPSSGAGPFTIPSFPFLCYPVGILDTRVQHVFKATAVGI